MRAGEDGIVLSASDLSNHLACGTRKCFPRPPRRSGRTITVVADDAGEDSAVERIRALVRAGADVIAQASLAGGRWYGRADVLLRVATPSDLGERSYSTSRSGAVIPREPRRPRSSTSTWRLNPSICAFTSEVFYEGRLDSLPGLETQALEGTTDFAGAGFWCVPVDHEGNQNSSPEEVERVCELIDLLTHGDAGWSGKDGEVRPLTLDDILVICPSNAQGYWHGTAASRRARRDGGQVPGAGGPSGHLLHDHVVAGEVGLAGWSSSTAPTGSK